MEAELVSVIVPVYNVENYIDACVESIVGQTYRNLEILLVDDGSTDSCGRKCDAWQEKDARIRVIHQTNAGMSSARNHALDICTGAWIVFVDSDDYVAPSYVERMHSLAVEYGVSVVQCEDTRVVRNTASGMMPGKAEKASTQEYPVRKTSAADFLAASDFKDAAWGKIYRAELFEGRRFPNVRIHEDTALIYQLVYAAGEAVRTEEPLYYYTVRPGSATAARSYDYDLLSILRFRKERTAFYRERGEEVLTRQNLRDYAYALLTHYHPVKNILRDRTTAHRIRKEYRSICAEVLTDPDISWKGKVLLAICYVSPTVWKYSIRQ